MFIPVRFPRAGSSVCSRSSAGRRSKTSIFQLVVLAAVAGCGDDAASPNRDAGTGDAAADATLPPSSPDAAGLDGGTSGDAAPDAQPEAASSDDAGTDAAPDDAAEGGAPSSDGGAEDADGASEAPTFGGMEVTTTPGKQRLDLFGAPGHRFWLEVSEEQLARMNRTGAGGPGPIFEPGPGDFGDIYTPGGSKTFADHVVIQDVETGSVADYGKIEARLVGESTFRNWTSFSIPNIKMDTDEFQKGRRFGTFEHIRLNNSLVGSIFRETIAHRIFRALDYPALRASFAFLGSNVWGEGIWVPMTLIEVYKFRFCDDNQELLGGNCTNMWEFPGDPGNGDIPANACQVKECDDTRLEELSEALRKTERGPGFKEALSSLVEWERFHQFQCLGWILSTGDDAIRNANNNLIIERDDGKLIWAPYSIDISAGQEWYVNTPLLGSSTMAQGCQADPDCWSATVAACEKLIDAFDALDPEKLVDETVATLTALGMMRDGDNRRGTALRKWYSERQTVLAAELEKFRYLPDRFGNCPDGLVACNDGGCGTEEQCEERRCEAFLVWCESYQNCVDPRYEVCPDCDEENPYYCQFQGVCVQSPEECWAECGGFPPGEYCPAYAACVPIGLCPNGGGDGGVPSFDGGFLPEPWPMPNPEPRPGGWEK